MGRWYAARIRRRKAVWMSHLGSMPGGRVEPGRALTSQFQVLAHVGRGGLGDLYRAQARASGQVLAVRATDIPDADVVLEAIRDVIALHDEFAHLPIARIRLCGGADGSMWYGMDYCEG